MRQAKFLTDRQLYLDILRICAAFAVIILHVAAQNWMGTDFKSLSWNVFNFYDSAVRWCVPVFVMISGALFLNGQQSVKSIYKKNLVRIALAFTVWSFFYSSISFFKGTGIKNAIVSFICGHYHMWFLYMMAGLYMIIPFLRIIAQDAVLVKYYLTLSFLFSFVIPQMISAVSFKSPDSGRIMQSIIDKVQLQFVLGYTFYFILGYVISIVKISKKMLSGICVLGLLGFISTVVLTVLVTYYYQKPNELFYGNFTINVFLESVVVFVLFKHFFEKTKIVQNKKCSIIFCLSKNCFGIYLIHPFIIDELNEILKLNTLSFYPVISVPVIAVIVFASSFLASEVLNHIWVLHRYIV